MADLGDINIGVGLDTSVLDSGIKDLGQKFQSIKDYNVSAGFDGREFERELRKFRDRYREPGSFNVRATLRFNQQEIGRARRDLERQLGNVNFSRQQDFSRTAVDPKLFDGIGERIGRSLGKSFSNLGENLGDSLSKSIKSAIPRQGITGFIGDAISAPFKAISRGIFEGIGQPLGLQMGKGLQQGIQSELGDFIGSFDLLGKSIGQGFVQDLIEALGADGVAIRKAFQDIIGIDKVQLESAFQRGKQSDEDLTKTSVAKRQTSVEKELLMARMPEIKAKGKSIQITANKLQGYVERITRLAEDFQKKLGIDSINDQISELEGNLKKIDNQIASTQIDESQDEAAQQKAIELSKSASSIAKELSKLNDRKKRIIEQSTQQYRSDYDKIAEIREKLSTAYFKSERELFPLDSLDAIDAAIAKMSPIKQAKKPKQVEKKSPPEILSFLAKKVAEDSGYSIKSNEIPEIEEIPDSIRGVKATGLYISESNTIRIPKTLLDKLKKAEALTRRELGSLVHELRHGVQAAFGKQAEGDSRTVRYLQPKEVSPSVLKQIAPKIENSVKGSGAVGARAEEIRKKEIDAYLYEHLYGDKIFQELQSFSKKAKVANVAGFGGGKIKNDYKNAFGDLIGLINATKDIEVPSSIQSGIESLKSFTLGLESSVAEIQDALIEGVDGLEPKALAQIEDRAVSVAEKIRFIIESTNKIKQKIGLVSTESFPDLPTVVDADIDSINKDIKSAQAKLPKQNKNLANIAEVALPKKYIEAAQQIAKLSNQSLSKDQIPKLALPQGDLLAKMLADNATGLFGDSLIKLAPDLFSAIKSGVGASQIDLGRRIEASATLTHELRHAAQKGFGKLSTKDLKAGNIGVSLLKATKQELEVIGKAIEESVSKYKGELPTDLVRSLEEDAYVFELRYTEAIAKTLGFLDDKNDLLKYYQQPEIESVLETSASNLSTTLEQSVADYLAQIEQSIDSTDIAPSNSSSDADEWMAQLNANVGEVKQDSVELTQDMVSYLAKIEQDINSTQLAVSKQANQSIEQEAKNIGRSFDNLTGLTKKQLQAIAKVAGLASKYTLGNLKVDNLKDIISKEIKPEELNRIIEHVKSYTKTGKKGGATVELPKLDLSAELRTYLQSQTKQIVAFARNLETSKPRSEDLSKAYANAENLLSEINELLKQGLEGSVAKTIAGYKSVVKSAILDIKPYVVKNSLSPQEISSPLENEIGSQPLAISEDLARIDLKRIENFVNPPNTEQSMMDAELKAAEAQASAENHLLDYEKAASNIERRYDVANKKLDESIKNLTSTSQPLDNWLLNLKTSFQNLIPSIGGVVKGFLAFQGVMWLQNFFQRVAAGAVDVFVKIDNLSTALKYAMGSAEAGASALRFVTKEVDRLRIPLLPAAEGFKQLSAATKGTQVEGQSTRELFTGVAEAATVLGLNAEQTGGAINALAQMASKGKVQAEELRGQLGERIPGAFALAARAVGVTESQLNKMLDTGQVISDDFLPRFGKQMRLQFGEAAKSASGNAQSSIFNFQNSITKLQANLGKAIAPTLMVGMNALAAAIQSVAVHMDKVAIAVSAASTVFLTSAIPAIKTTLVSLILTSKVLPMTAAGWTQVGLSIGKFAAQTALLSATILLVKGIADAVNTDLVQSFNNAAKSAQNAAKAANEALTPKKSGGDRESAAKDLPSVNWVDDLSRKYVNADGITKFVVSAFTGFAPAIGEGINRGVNLLKTGKADYTSYADLQKQNLESAITDIYGGGVNTAASTKLSLAEFRTGKGQFAEIKQIEEELKKAEEERRILQANIQREFTNKGLVVPFEKQKELESFKNKTGDLVDRRAEAIRPLMTQLTQVEQQIENTKNALQNLNDPNTIAAIGGEQAAAEQREKLQASLDGLRRVKTEIDEAMSKGADPLQSLIREFKNLAYAIDEAERAAKNFGAERRAAIANTQIKNFATDPLAGRSAQMAQLQTDRDAIKKSIESRNKALQEALNQVDNSGNAGLMAELNVNRDTSVTGLQKAIDTLPGGDENKGKKELLERMKSAKELEEQLLQDKASLAQQEVQIRQQAEQDALYAIQQSVANQDAVIRQGENARVGFIKEQQRQRIATEEQVAESLARIQLDSSKKQFNSTEQELAAVRDKHKQGIISAEQFAQQERELTTKLSDQKRQIAENELAVQEAINRRRIANVEFTNRQEEAAIEAAGQKRINKIKARVASGQLSDRQAQPLILKEQATGINQQEEGVRNQMRRDRILHSQNAIDDRELATRNAQNNQKLLQLEQQRQENRQQQNQQALQDLEFYNKRAESLVEASQLERINIIKQKQSEGILSERQAQAEITLIQKDAISEQIAEAKKQIEQTQQLKISGKLSPEDATTKQLELNQRLGQLSQQQIDSEIQINQKQFIEELERSNQQAEQAIEASQTKRINIAKQKQADGVLSERQVQEEITQIQGDGLNQQIELIKKQLQENQNLKSTGKRSAEEAAQKEVELTLKLGQINGQRIDNELQKLGSLREALRETFDLRKAELDLESARAQVKIASREADVLEISGEISPFQRLTLDAESLRVEQAKLIKQRELLNEQLSALPQMKLSSDQEKKERLSLLQNLASLDQQYEQNRGKLAENRFQQREKLFELGLAGLDLKSAQSAAGLDKQELEGLKFGKPVDAEALRMQRELAKLRQENQVLNERRSLIEGKLNSSTDPKVRLELTRELASINQQLYRNEAEAIRTNTQLAISGLERRIGLSESRIALTAAQAKAKSAEREALIAESSGGAIDAITQLKLQREALQLEQRQAQAQLQLNQEKLAVLPQRKLGTGEDSERNRLLTEQADIQARVFANRKALAENIGQMREKHLELELAQITERAGAAEIAAIKEEIGWLKEAKAYNQERVGLEQQANKLIGERATLIAKQQFAQARVSELGANAPQELRLNQQNELNEAIKAVYLNEKSLLETNRKIASAKVDSEIAAAKRLGETRIQAAEREKAAQDRVLRSLDLQKQLMESRANLQKAMTQAAVTQQEGRVDDLSRTIDAIRRLREEENLNPEVRTALEAQVSSSGMAPGTSVEDAIAAKQQEEDNLAQARIEVRLEEEAIARRQLEIEIRRNELTAKMQLMEANIAAQKAQQAEYEARMNQQKAIKTGDSEQIAKAQFDYSIAQSQRDLATAQVSIAQENLDAQAELSDNSKRTLNIQQQSAAAQSRSAEKAREQAQALEKAEVKAKGVAKASERSASAAAASTSMLLMGENITQSREASTMLRRDLQQGGKLGVLQGLMGSTSANNPFYELMARQQGMGDLADLARKLAGNVNPLEMQRIASDAAISGKDVVSELRALGDRIDNLATRPSVGTLQISSPNPTRDAMSVMRDLTANSMRS